MSRSWPEVTPDEEAAARRFRHKRLWRCPACLQDWYAIQGLKRHMAVLHHRCRFCTKAYILVDQHEKRSHTNEYAIADGACARKVPA